MTVFWLLGQVDAGLRHHLILRPAALYEGGRSIEQEDETTASPMGLEFEAMATQNTSSFV